MQTIAYIGLGIMGRPMALNLRRAGYPVRVWARRSAMMQPLVEAGAIATHSAAEAAAGGVVVDMSTISPSVTRSIAERLAERGIDMLDAPVSGGEQGAIDGQLSIMVGGPVPVFDRVLPLFEVLGRNIVHIGGSGAGQVTKACNQAVVAQAINAVGEALVFARAAGVDPARVREALLGGFAGSRVLESHGERMIAHDFKPGFKARLHRKSRRPLSKVSRSYLTSSRPWIGC